MDFIEKIKIKKRELNTIQVKKEVEQDWVVEKIKNYLNRNKHIQMTVKEVQEEILKNDLVASFFAKDPSKQNISEKEIGKMVSLIKGVSNFNDLPSSTNFYLYRGELVELYERPIGLKTVDYLFDYNSRPYVCCQKYTTGQGGHQDNQYNDVVSFLENSKNYKDGQVLALLDGDYYNKSNLQKLKTINSDAIICSILELEEILNEQ